jgi:hypothetical protein
MASIGNFPLADAPAARTIAGVAVAAAIDADVLKCEIKKTYAAVSQDPERVFSFPTGRAWAEDLGYPPELARVPDTAVASFAGVANPWELGRVAAGECVLDLGCGAGTDTLIAAQMVGTGGRVIGIDMTVEMLDKARTAADEMGCANVELKAVFAEIHGVLRRGGRLQIADVTIQRPVSEEGKRNIDLWTG